MFKKATEVRFLKDVTLECKFEDGKIIRFDMSSLFSKFPQYKELLNSRELFLSGKLDYGNYVISWNDDLDIDCSLIYEKGKLVEQEDISFSKSIGIALFNARTEAWVTQKELSNLSGIDQADISRIESGEGNPTLKKIEKLFNALGKKPNIVVK